MLEETRQQFLQVGQLFLMKLYRALFAAAYYGLLRVGEITMGTHPILSADVHIAMNKKNFLFILRTSKTHWKDSKPQMVKLTSSSSMLLGKFSSNAELLNRQNYCPFRILQEYLMVQGPAERGDEPFFILPGRIPVTPQHLQSVLTKLLESIGVNSQLYLVHSFRIGRASDMLHKLHFSVETIKKEIRVVAFQ